MRTIQGNICSDPRSFFAYVNQKRKTNGYPTVMELNGASASDSKGICGLFHDFFRSVYTPAPNIAFSTNGTPADRLGSMSLSLNDILIGLNGLKSNKGAGPDMIPPSLLRNCAVSLCQPLHRLFNESLSTGHFPSIWKSSRITPIFKSGSRKQITNYRGIAILPTIGKLFEAIVSRRLMSRVAPLISRHQHGFVAAKSTTTNLLEFTNAAIGAIGDGFQLDVVYTDFSKAFDRVPLDILISKLAAFGIHAALLEWLKSYLVGRTQYVRWVVRGPTVFVLRLVCHRAAIWGLFCSSCS